MINQKTFNNFPEWFKPFSIGFDIIDLMEVLKKYDIPQKTSLACIRFYCGRPLK